MILAPRCKVSSLKIAARIIREEFKMRRVKVLKRKVLIANVLAIQKDALTIGLFILVRVLIALFFGVLMFLTHVLFVVGV